MASRIAVCSGVRPCDSDSSSTSSCVEPRRRTKASSSCVWFSSAASASTITCRRSKSVKLSGLNLSSDLSSLNYYITASFAFIECVGLCNCKDFVNTCEFILRSVDFTACVNSLLIIRASALFPPTLQSCQEADLLSSMQV